ncbi:MAG: class I SAM-dependent methyltransferase [Cyanobacteria bacterium P01_D01_bin.128]
MLTNDYSATGFAVDISYHQLNAAKYFSELFNRPRLPIRVCCDVGNLPFKPEAFSLAFCYQFIHHFPTPKIVIDQINRVLGDGIFFFAEEPFQGFKVSLYRQKDSIYSKAALRKNKLIRFIERFISEEYCEEREYGILENDDIPIGVWLDALSDFKHRDIRLDSLQGRISSKLGDSVSFSNFANAVIGGSIRATCKKQAKLQLESPSVTAHETAAHETTAQETTALEALLLCPDCGMEAEDASSQTSSQTTLYRENDQLHCPNCGASFPIVNDVIILLPKALLKELYPEFAG